MNGGSSKRTRSERVASLRLPPSQLQQLWATSKRGRVWARFALAILAAGVMLVACRAWRPPFSYRPGYIPPRDMVARVNFEVFDRSETELLQRQKRREVLVYYRNRIEPLTQLREALKDKLFVILSAESIDQMSADAQQAWPEFVEGDETASPAESASAQFVALRETLVDDPKLQRLDEAVRAAQLPYYETGLLSSLGHSIGEGNQRVIRVYQAGAPESAEPVEVDRVRIAQVGPNLRARLVDEFEQRFDSERADRAAGIIADWMVARLPETLSYDRARSDMARKEAEAAVEPVMTTYYAGYSRLAPAGQPLGESSKGPESALDLLRVEWESLLREMSVFDRLVRLGAYFGMIAALYLLCGAYIYFVHDRRLILDLDSLTKLLGLIVATVVLCQFASATRWQAEVVPLTLAAMTATVVYGRPLALLLLGALALAVTLFIGQDLADFVSLSSAALSAILLLGRIRTRQRLIYVGAGAALVTAATVVGVGVVSGQTLGSGQPATIIQGTYQALGFGTLLETLLEEALWYGGGALLAGFLMAGLLPFVERVFGVQTDLSLLELGDASHPLLRQLAQRAPGTYNHSINVASIAEAAADGIGANGLLVRVGAYFHDIGKMFKPNYFIENQGQGPNEHMRLQPAMSTLVIIAHVKDGADLARSYHLPDPIIDFILQHHGTTLVEYFYREAAKRSEQDPNGEEVSDKDFRYPGPKPQSLEAAVLMLADGVESASRTLVDPTPARIHNLVDQIAMKRLTDGQFDECGLTLRQLSLVKQSLVKSLTAIYHARVKYPGQQSA